MLTIMFFNKLFKSFKKKSSLILFSITILYFFYTYVSLFLFIFNNALFYLFVNIYLFYLCFHFVIRALTYPGSLLLYLHKTNYDNKIELCKFYMKECVKLSFIINNIRGNIKKISKEKDDPNGNYKIKLQNLFSDNNYKDNYFNFFSGLYIFYTLYISYYLYINLEENGEFSEEQLYFYYYLKLFMTKINEINIYINKDDIIYQEMVTKIKIHEDQNQLANEFIKKKSMQRKKSRIGIKKKGETNSFWRFEWIYKFRNRVNNKNVSNPNELEEKQKLLSECDKTMNINDYKKKKEAYNSNEDNNIPSNYIDVNILSLYYHENYEKSISHANYMDFFMAINLKELSILFEDLAFVLNKLCDIFKSNTLRERIEITKIPNLFNKFSKNYIAGTLDLFKYELIYKYYGKQQYLYVNNIKIDSMFIPCKKFLNDNMQKYINIKKSGKKIDINKDNSNTSCIFSNAFNNEFYNYIYNNDYLYNIPIVLYFNPNGAYYELNACYSGVLKFYLENNINVFVYNYRGYNKSQGYPNLNRNNLDALKITEFLLSKNVKYLGLHGTSIGGPLCSYVSYHLCNFNKKNMNTELMDKLYKNEIYIKIAYKQMNKTIKLMNRKKNKILINIFLIPFKCIILLLQFIMFCKLKVANAYMKRKINISNTKRQLLLNNYEQSENSKISFVCVDKSFYNFEEVARYMVGEYAYNILQFTTYKLDITKYYMNSNISRIIIYDNNDEIIHHMSNVITGISKEVSKMYKHSNYYINSRKEICKNEKNEMEIYKKHIEMDEELKEGNVDDKSDELNNNINDLKKYNLLPLNVDDNNNFDKENNNVHNLSSGNNNDYLFGKKNDKKGNDNNNKKNILNFFNTNKDKPTFIETMIIDEYVDISWCDNKLKKIDLRLFLESWKVLCDCILFLNKSSTTNNSFISIGLETFKSIMSVYNSKEDKFEQATRNAAYCIYNNNMSFMDNFKKVNCNYTDIIMMECINNNNNFKKANIYELLKENEDYKIEMENLNKILKDLYMSKRKEIEKMHFTYSGFFIKEDCLYDYINTENRNNEEQNAFNIKEGDVIKFLNEFSDSIIEIVNAMNYNLNACGQLFNELNKISENEKVYFLKSFIYKMKVFGSYPSQCFVSTNNTNFCNSFYQIPFILSQYSDTYTDSETTPEDLKDVDIYNSDIDETFLNNISEEENNIKKKTRNIKIKKSKDITMYNHNTLNNTQYITLKKSILLHDLIICLNYYKKYDKRNSFNIFYKLDNHTYLLDIKELLSFIKKNKIGFNINNDSSFNTSKEFLDIFSNDIGKDQNDSDFSYELEKYVSWMRLNSRMNLCKIFILLREELNKMLNYSKILMSEYNNINQNTNIHFIIFFIYRIIIFKKILTHTYIVYIFLQRLNSSLDIVFNEDERNNDIDIKSLEPISSFNIFYKDAYKIYSPKTLGFPLMVNCGHNGSLDKENLNFFGTCINFLLKKYV
ncbi:hypothetical protein YYC_00728 [Plasmodium yoelii 17X]|uniref:Uncharacterized protein n=1 Tax=Plasmodium yoelii 17X TaxID=1323249 RepID=V7PU51_PLAYE|nr:hypothetical protein YYC_00728 [Plasmodium yoelii 17X]